MWTWCQSLRLSRRKCCHYYKSAPETATWMQTQESLSSESVGQHDKKQTRKSIRFVLRNACKLEMIKDLMVNVVQD